MSFFGDVVLGVGETVAAGTVLGSLEGLNEAVGGRKKKAYKVRVVRHNKEGHRVGRYSTVYASSPEQAALLAPGFRQSRSYSKRTKRRR
jgi:hypothetical protein